MDAINFIRDKARAKQARIILPEKKDPRMAEAVKIIEKEKLANVIFLGEKDLDQAKIEKYAQEFLIIRQSSGMDIDKARKFMQRPLFYAAMMVRSGEADGFVAGAINTTSDVARAAIYCIGIDKNAGLVSSSFLMIVPECVYGEEGVFFFADCGIIPNPSAQQLAQIAISTASLAKKVLGITPRVAMLSFSTKNSASGKMIGQVQEATNIAKTLAPDLIIDGELQADTAIVPEISKIKDPNGALRGRANILIFPDLEAGNIAYKLVERLAKAKALGPLLQGLNKPGSDLSRGCSVDDIVNCTAITAIRAQG